MHPKDKQKWLLRATIASWFLLIIAASRSENSATILVAGNVALSLAYFSARLKISNDFEKLVRENVEDQLSKEYRAYHEAGHTIFCIHKDTPYSLSHVSIKTDKVSGGRASMSANMTGLPSYEQMINTIMMLQAGKLALDLHFGNSVDLRGDRKDKEMAKEIANNIIHNYGERLKIEFGTNKPSVKKILKTCEKEAKIFLKGKRQELDIVAQELIKRETLETEEVHEMLGLETSDHHIYVQLRESDLDTNNPALREPYDGPL